MKLILDADAYRRNAYMQSPTFKARQRYFGMTGQSQSCHISREAISTATFFTKALIWAEQPASSL
jgi:hypothetical protein